ncbi:DUF397 domain-containing protein [Nocardia terpenica]|uniref:DUF397 domain-containing protein n=1 Tax=Nocardia terpenica TaxID=455432 RepID=A0A6G9Z7A5_9NOCA|nr:DUF397 domain-containing protein [Nocardia terpenica]QIS20893.1 DUF397 domain-containing protein [Nocardia terpenica]
MSRTSAATSAPTSWIKSSHSNASQSCVEIRFGDGVVLIRDSKYLRDPANDSAAQPFISIPTDDWPAFLDAAIRFDSRPGLPAIEHHASGEVSLRAADGTTLTYTAAEWTAFVSGVRAGEFAA